jgi:hypothetical protein
MRHCPSVMIKIGLVIVFSSGCSAAHPGDGAAESSGSATGTGILQGHLYGVGGPATGSQEAWPGIVTLTSSGFRRDIPVGADGSYSVTLAPGLYTVVGHSPRLDNGNGSCVAANAAHVVAGATVTDDVLCHIR